MSLPVGNDDAIQTVVSLGAELKDTGRCYFFLPFHIGRVEATYTLRRLNLSRQMVKSLTICQDPRTLSKGKTLAESEGWEESGS